MAILARPARRGDPDHHLRARRAEPHARPRRCRSRPTARCSKARSAAQGHRDTLNAATPLIFTGLSVAIGFKAGLFNIGANGQLLIGGFCAAIVGTIAGIPFPIAMLLALAGGGARRRRLGLHPGRPEGLAWRPRGGDHDHAQQHRLPAARTSSRARSSRTRTRRSRAPRTSRREAALPIISGGHAADPRDRDRLLTAVFIWFLLYKTTLGFEIRTVGSNASAARYAGIRPAFIIILTMSIAGGLAGLGGSVEILGITKNYPAEYIVTYGFDGIAVALLGRAHPVRGRRRGVALRDHAGGRRRHAARDRDPRGHHRDRAGDDPAVRGGPGRHRPRPAQVARRRRPAQPAAAAA